MSLQPVPSTAHKLEWGDILFFKVRRPNNFSSKANRWADSEMLTYAHISYKQRNNCTMAQNECHTISIVLHAD
jgi:hypothetical protein